MLFVAYFEGYAHPFSSPLKSYYRALTAVPENLVSVHLKIINTRVFPHSPYQCIVLVSVSLSLAPMTYVHLHLIVIELKAVIAKVEAWKEGYFDTLECTFLLDDSIMVLVFFRMMGHTDALMARQLFLKTAVEKNYELCSSGGHALPLLRWHIRIGSLYRTSRIIL